MIEWRVLPRRIANENMYEVLGMDGEKKEVYGGLFETEEDAQRVADKLNKAQKGDI